MNRKKWYVGGGFAVVLASTLTLASLSANAADTAPTIEDAQSALNHIDQDQATIQAYLDSISDKTKPQNLTADVGDTKVTLHWSAPTSGSPTGYVYGRDGADSTGYGSYTSDVQPLTTTSAVLDKLVNGTAYNVFVEAVYPSGNKRTSITVTPTAGASTPTPSATGSASPTASATPSATPTGSSSPTASVTPSATPTTTSAPAGRLSGLPYSSGVWADSDRGQTSSFITTARGGVPIDNQLVYTSRSSMASQNNPSDWASQLPANFNPTRQDLVLGLTTWTADGAYMNQSQASAIGNSVCGIDSVHPIVRIDWEMNLQDGAGVNGAVLTASNYSAWVSRFRTVATALKGACPGLLVDFNINHGVDQTTGCNSGTYAAPNNCTRQAFQSLKDVIDIFGIDTYDSYPPVTSSNSGWSTRTNANNFGELENVRAYAVANGKKFSVPEWGVACNVAPDCQWAGHAGGDDPTYMHDMVSYFVAHAGDMAYETYFNENQPYIISDLTGNNPNSRTMYRNDLANNRS